MDVRLVAALFLSLAGCAVAPIAPEPHPLATGSDARGDDDDSGDDDDIPIAKPTTRPVSSSSSAPAGAQPPRVWTGQLTKTATVRFGGDPYCYYDVVLGDLHVNLTLDDTANLLQSNVTSIMTETTPSCTQAPIGSKALTYASSGAAKGLNAVAQVVPGKDVPLSTVTITGSMADTGKMHATLVFHRTDSADVLNWTLTTELDLVPAAGSQAPQGPK